MPTDRNDARLILRLPADLLAWLTDAAARDRRPVSAYARLLLERAREAGVDLRPSPPPTRRAPPAARRASTRS